MAKGKKTGGRVAGVPNKTTQDLLRICEEEGVEPFRAMVQHAKLITDPEPAVAAWEKVCQYIHAKRKALEVDIDPESTGFRILIEEFGKK